MNMPGLGQPQAEDKKEGFTSTPAFKIIFNATLFIAGVVFIQSPVMDLMVPQLN